MTIERRAILVACNSLKAGILLVNTGTPSAPTPRAVKRYLSKFLMDARIRPMNAVGWWFILHLFILPKRKRASAKKYKQLWSDDGFFFATTHAKLEEALQQVLSDMGNDVVVRHAMSYSEPSIPRALKQLKSSGCQRLIVLPLYPQSAYSTTGSVKDGVSWGLRKARWQVDCEIVDNYHSNPTYVRAIAASIRNAGFKVEGDDRLLFSYHSIPAKDIEDGDRYELQTGSSSLHIASELGIERKRWTIGYQCRFDKGREWIGPFTKDVLARWAEQPQSRIFFICPNFAVDCLETLYEIAEELKPYYFSRARQSGFTLDDESFIYVPCLNKSKAHLKVLVDVLLPHINKD